MNKFIRLMIGAAVLLAGGVQASTPCSAVDFTSFSSKTFIASLNSLIDGAKSMLPTMLASQDPLVIANKTLAVQTISALGYSFNVTPILSSVSITGLKNAVPRHLNATSSDKMDVGANVNGTLTGTGTLSLVITQTNRSWYQVCLTNPLSPSKCSALTVAMDFSLGLVNPSFVAHTIADLVSCPANATACSDVGLSEVIAAALLGRATSITDRILRRFTDASVDSVSLAFDSVSTLSFSFKSAGQLITAISYLLVKFSKDTLNNKGDNYSNVLVYVQYIEVVQTLLTSVLNDLIQEKLKPRFGSTCYDK